MDARKSAIFAFQFVKPILQTITLVMSVSKKSSADLSELEKYVVSNCIQYTVLEIQFWSVKCTTVTVRYKFRKFHYQAMRAIATIRLDINKPLQNAFKRI